MNTAYSSKQQTKKTPENFMEALSGLKSDFAQEAKIQVRSIVTQDIPEALGLTPASGTLSPNESFSMSELNQAERVGHDSAKREFDAQLHQLREQEQARMIRQEAQLKQEIKAIQEEVRTLAKTTGEFTQEIEMATFQAVAHPRAYPKNFSFHLRTIVIALRKRVADSRHWL